MLKVRWNTHTHTPTLRWKCCRQRDHQQGEHTHTDTNSQCNVRTRCCSSSSSKGNDGFTQKVRYSKHTQNTGHTENTTASKGRREWLSSSSGHVLDVCSICTPNIGQKRARPVSMQRVDWSAPICKINWKQTAAGWLAENGGWNINFSCTIFVVKHACWQRLRNQLTKCVFSSFWQKKQWRLSPFTKLPSWKQPTCSWFGMFPR